MVLPGVLALHRQQNRLAHTCTPTKASCQSCRLVQVAIVVDDRSLDEWVKLAGECLRYAAEKAHGTDATEEPSPSGPLSSDTAALSLASLHQHSQRMILSAASAQDPSCMLDMIQWLPQSLHTAIVDAAIKAPDRTLEACFQDYHQLPPILDALATLSADPPSIASLHVTFTYKPDTPRTTEEASHIATALRHHSALSTLQLGMDATNSQAELLAPAIAALSSLKTLHLGSHDTHFSVDAIPALQAALHSLPQLDCLLVSLDVTSQPPPLKRQRDADTPDAPPPSRHCLATLISSAPDLTSLHIELGSLCDQSLAAPQLVAPGEILPDGASVSLQHLSHLMLSVDDCTMAARLLRSLHASPLTSLVIEQSDSRHVEDDAARAEAVRELCAFPQLRSMHINSAPETWAARALRILLQTPPTALTALQGLSELQIEVEFRGLHMAALQLAATLPALRQLTIICDCLHRGGLQSSREGWAQVLEHLSALQLQDLDLCVTDNRADTAPVLSALLTLTGLSTLKLQAYNMMRAPADVEAISRMTQLRSLHLIGFTLPAELRTRLVPALLPLRRLTELFVFDNKGVHVACGAQLHGAWPEVRHLSVSLNTSRPRAGLRAVLRAMCGLPALQHLDLFDQHRGGSGELGDRGGLGEGSVDVPGSLWDVAAEAGVEADLTGECNFMDP